MSSTNLFLLSRVRNSSDYVDTVFALVAAIVIAMRFLSGIGAHVGALAASSCTFVFRGRAAGLPRSALRRRYCNSVYGESPSEARIVHIQYEGRDISCTF